ncbi:hypothetical protein D1007_42340 [Hordeum vulgare]|nr:hypothetical protein D1007_42340 [Hordeum vulgare]
MVPANKKGKATAPLASTTRTGLALMPSRVLKVEDLDPVLPFVAGNTHKWGAIPICSGSAVPSILIQALHLQPNSVLLLAIFNFYCEAFVGEWALVALFHHFFSLRSIARGECSACMSFVDVGGAGTHLKVKKKVEGHWSHWVFMDAHQESSLLASPLSSPEQTPKWGHKKLSDPRAHSHPLWEFTAAGDPICPLVSGLTHDKLDGVLDGLLGHCPKDLPQATPPLYACDDVDKSVAKMPVFNE